MPSRRLLRFDRSSVAFLAVMLTAVLAVLAFGNLAIIKRDAVLEQQSVQLQFQQLQEQNRRLTYALEQARHGQNIQPKAWQYYHKTPRGTIVVEAAPAGDAPAVQADIWDSLPSWVRPLERLWQTLTSARK